MNPEPTADALVQLVHRYYPASLRNDDPRYDASEEGQHLEALIQTQTAISGTRPSPAMTPVTGSVSPCRDS